MALPTLQVEVAWTTNITGVFRVGPSLLDGPDVLAGAFGGNVFDDITAYIREIECDRGRSDDLGPVDQGSCRLLLKDTAGRFNPENPTSDLAPYLVPMRPVRVRAIHNGTTYGVFYGFIERIEHDPFTHETSIECVDLFEWLAVASDSFVDGSITSAGDAIGAYLDELEFTDPAFRSIDAGRAISLTNHTQEGEYLGGIQDVVAYDRGIFFVMATGVVRYISGAAYWAKAAPIVDLDASFSSDLKAAVDKQRIVNRVAITKTGGTAQTATDTTSTGRYGFRDGAALTSDYLADDTEALNLARWIVAILKDPGTPTKGVELIGADDARLTQILAREIGDRVAFSETRGGTDSEGVIEGVKFSWAIGALPKARFLISKRRRDAFTVGQSHPNGVDALYW